MKLESKEILSAVITAVMSGKQAERDDACKKLQGHILSVEAERDAREAECERLYAECVALRASLIKAVDVIRIWHNMGMEDSSNLWDIYWRNAPEMKAIRETLTAESATREGQEDGAALRSAVGSDNRDEVKP